AHASCNLPWRGCAARSAWPKPRRRMRCAIRSPRIFSREGVISEPFRSCSATPRSRPRRSTRRSIPSNCCRFTGAPIRALNLPCAAARLGFNRQWIRQEGAAMAGAHENLETAEHAQHAAHEGGNNKKIALIISVLALFLAFSETFGKSAQTAALNAQIEASNLWNFFQAKNIRRTLTIVASESAKIDLATAPDETRKALIAKQIEQWDKTAA